MTPSPLTPRRCTPPAGQPQLILAHRNDLVAGLSGRLDGLGVAHTAIDARWFLDQGTRREEAFAAAVDRAGRPGQVLVINMQGARGVDIPLTAAARDAGGLHVRVTARSGLSADIDIQAQNRAARSGDPGSVAYYISPDDDAFALSPSPGVRQDIIRYATALHTRDQALGTHTAALSTRTRDQATATRGQAPAPDTTTTPAPHSDTTPAPHSDTAPAPHSGAAAPHRGAAAAPHSGAAAAGGGAPAAGGAALAAAAAALARARDALGRAEQALRDRVPGLQADAARRLGMHAPAAPAAARPAPATAGPAAAPGPPGRRPTPRPDKPPPRASPPRAGSPAGCGPSGGSWPASSAPPRSPRPPPGTCGTGSAR